MSPPCRWRLRRPLAIRAPGKLEAGDREYIVSHLASRAGISPSDAEKRIDDAFAKITQAGYGEAGSGESPQDGGSLKAAVLLVGAAASWMGAMLEGKHRDEELDLSHLIRRG